MAVARVCGLPPRPLAAGDAPARTRPRAQPYPLDALVTEDAVFKVYRLVGCSIKAVKPGKKEPATFSTEVIKIYDYFQLIPSHNQFLLLLIFPAGTSVDPGTLRVRTVFIHFKADDLKMSVLFRDPSEDVTLKKKKAL